MAINQLGARYCALCKRKIGTMVGDDTYRILKLDRNVATRIGAPKGKRGYWCDECADRKDG